jgi:hypothetical protein
MRLLLLNGDGFVLLKSLKVHKNGISHIKFSMDGCKLAVVSEAGDLFFLTIDGLQDIKPYCLH